MDKHLLCRVVIVTALALTSHSALARGYAEARADLVAAYQAEDYAAMVAAAEEALPQRA